MIKRLFLVGCARSGTTLLQSMISTHSKIVSFPETHLFADTVPVNSFLRLFKIYGASSRSKLSQKMKELGLATEQIFLPESIIIKSSVWAEILLKNIDSLAHHHAEEKPEFWLEKTPRHLCYISLISVADPSSRFIHIIRRGRDVAASMHFATKKYPEQWGGMRSVKKCVYWWNRSIKHSKRYLGNPHHIFISYEQLIGNPEIVMKAFCQKIDLPYTAEMSQSFHKTASALIKEEEKWKNRNSSAQLSNSNKFERLSMKNQNYINETIADFPYQSIYF